MSSGSPGQRTAMRGFTLVELLVAISILGLLMTAAFGALRLGSRSLEESVRRADRTEEIRSSADFLRRQLAHLVPLSRGDGGERELVFAGEPDAVRFVSIAPDGLAGIGLLLLTLRIDDGDGQTNVWLDTSPYSPGDTDLPDFEAFRRSLLLRDLSYASLHYFGAASVNERPAWRDQWPLDAEQFPVAIRLEVRAGDGELELGDLLFPIRSEELR